MVNFLSNYICFSEKFNILYKYLHVWKHQIYVMLWVPTGLAKSIHNIRDFAKESTAFSTANSILFGKFKSRMKIILWIVLQVARASKSLYKTLTESIQTITTKKAQGELNEMISNDLANIEENKKIKTTNENHGGGAPGASLHFSFLNILGYYFDINANPDEDIIQRFLNTNNKEQFKPLYDTLVAKKALYMTTLFLDEILTLDDTVLDKYKTFVEYEESNLRYLKNTGTYLKNKTRSLFGYKGGAEIKYKTVKKEKMEELYKRATPGFENKTISDFIKEIQGKQKMVNTFIDSMESRMNAEAKKTAGGKTRKRKGGIIPNFAKRAASTISLKTGDLARRAAQQVVSQTNVLGAFNRTLYIFNDICKFVFKKENEKMFEEMAKIRDDTTIDINGYSYQDNTINCITTTYKYLMRMPFLVCFGIASQLIADATFGILASPQCFYTTKLCIFILLSFVPLLDNADLKETTNEFT
jgi:hypothetical protein